MTGLTAEALLAAPLGTARAGGGLPAGAARAAEALVAEGATALISFGLAGGLNPALPAGTLIIPALLRTASRDYPADPMLTLALGGPAHRLFAADAVVVSAAAKAVLFASSGADGVDLETGAVAEVAARHGLPFAALRAICDPAAADLPPAALIALTATGSITLPRVVASVLAKPWQLPALVRLGRDAGRAQAALRRHVAGLQLPLKSSV